MYIGLKYLLFIFMGLTLITIATGLFSMMKGGIFNTKYANALMRWRIIFQGISLLLFAALLMLR